MAISIITHLGKRRLLEGVLESVVPMIATGLAISLAFSRLSTPTAGRVLGNLEVFLTLAAPVMLLTWTISRLAFMGGMRRPWKFAVLNLILIGMVLSTLPGFSSDSYRQHCKELGGRLRPVQLFQGLREPDVRGEASGILDQVCQLNSKVPSLYLSGTLVRPAWRGMPQVLPWGGLGLALAVILTTLATRDRRLLRTRMAMATWEGLRLAAGSGSQSVLPSDTELIGRSRGRWKACANPTVWGELCGQLYPAAREFFEGEACARCGLQFKSSPMAVLSVVSLRFGDLDYLNDLEAREARIWLQGSGQPPQKDTLEPRWELLGEVILPDVISMSQALALIQEWLKNMKSDEPGRDRTIQMAQKQASYLSAWCWFSDSTPSLKLGIPTRDVALGVGAQRLRDLFGGRSGWKGIQLDIGLMPVDLRLGFWKPPENRSGEVSDARVGRRWNNRQVFWLPVAGVALNDSQGGMWVPRVEGAGLRAWLTLTSRNARFSPAPYQWEQAPWESFIQLQEPYDVDQQPLSLVRLPTPEEDVLSFESLLGCHLSEWDWLDRRHLELLRRQSVIMAPYEIARWEIVASHETFATGTSG